MAIFKQIILPVKIHDLRKYNCWIVNGDFTEEDVNLINSKNNIMLIFSNTKGINKDLIRKLNNTVKISILGGLDYINKNKYKGRNYIERTIFTPTSLYKVIEYFEKIESKIRYSWTDEEKCMYVYKTLAEYLHYKYDEEDDYENKKDIVRSLDGLLYGRLVCAGFALVFKEMMDRLGIKCEYQNMQRHHSWNTVEFDGKYYGLDLTWDCSNKSKDNECNFYYFCNDEEFYKNKNHNLSKEAEEVKYNLSTFSNEKIKSMRNNINNGNVKTKNMEKIIDIDGNIIYFIRFSEKEDYYKYMVYYDNQLNIINTTSKDPSILTKKNIEYALSNNGCIENIEDINNEYVKYYRDDSSQFFIKKTQKLQNNIYEFYYYEIFEKDNELIFRRGIVLSEMDLTINYSENIKDIIANQMLSKERIKRKINYYNGYVGFIGNDLELYCYSDFEQNELGIMTRK